MDKLLGFAPDADPTATGVLTACTNLIPGEKGIESAPTSVAVDAPVLANECRGAVVTIKLDDTRRVFAGTTTNLYELVLGSWVDVSGATYTGGAETRWQFAQFGDSTLASNLSDTIQRSAGSGAFASVSGAPKARVIFTVGAFVMALNTDDASNGVNPDRWWCSAAYDDTDWTPAVATQSATGRLVSAPGRITAGGRLGDYAVAYKEKAIYLGQYVGSPIVWNWQQIPGGEAGCIGQEAWCDIGGTHFIVGMDNMWLFDGSRPVPVATGVVRQWFFDNSDPSFRYRTRCTFDRQNNRVWVFFPSVGSDSPDQALVYHLGTKQWGRVVVNNQASLNYIGEGYTMDTMDGAGATYDTLPDVSYESQFWLAAGQNLAIFDASNQLSTMTGAAADSSLTTWSVGDDDIYSLLTKVRMRFSPGSRPTSATLTAYAGTNLTDFAEVTTSTLSDGKFDVLSSGRWHKAQVNFVGPHVVNGLQWFLAPESNR